LNQDSTAVFWPANFENIINPSIGRNNGGARYLG
jgi:hypothetical protein